MLDYTPMPGEKLESAEDREKRRREQIAIENGENFNPNLTDEAAAGFENLSNEVPFAGEHSSSNVVAAEFNEQWDQGITPDLSKVQESVERDYIDGAIEQSVDSPNTQADISETNQNGSEHSDAAHDISEAAAVQAVAAAKLSEDIAEGIKNGDEDALAQADEVRELASKAEAEAQKISGVAAEAGSNETEIRMAENVAEQASSMAQEAVDNVDKAQAEFDSMSEEEKEETRAAAEAAEENGTTVEEEKAKIEENEDDWKPDLSRGIFG